MELQQLVNKNATEKDLKLTICLANCAIFRIVETILRGQQPKFEDFLNAASCFATSVYVAHEPAKAREVIESIQNGVQEVKKSMQESNEDVLVSFAEEIGICSEFDIPYTLTERMILLFVACEKIGLEFDFSWNL